MKVFEPEVMWSLSYNAALKYLSGTKEFATQDKASLRIFCAGLVFQYVVKGEYYASSLLSVSLDEDEKRIARQDKLRHD